jgi:hypothetical protein
MHDSGNFQWTKLTPVAFRLTGFAEKTGSGLREHPLQWRIVPPGRVFQRSRGLHGRRKPHLHPSGRGRAWRAPVVAKQSGSSESGQSNERGRQLRRPIA